MKFRRGPIYCAVLVCAAAAPLRAQQAPADIGISEPSIATSLPKNGDPFGIRKRLNDRGITYNVIYTNDVLSNLSGGIQRGTIDQGKLEAQLYVDLGKFAGWKDWTFYVNAFQIHNTGRIRRDDVGGMNTIAAIEAAATTRLSELWLERQFGSASIRFGQLAADAEFFYSDVSQLFLQSDWPTIAAVNLPGGGPAYPLSALGARIKYEFPKDASLLFAIFNGDPAGPCPGDPDTCNRYGVNFRLHDPAFMIGEMQFRWNRGKDDTGLATTLKVGGWTHLGQFADQRFDNTGMLLASPASNGVPLMHRGDYGVYGVIDQQLYRPRGGNGDSLYAASILAVRASTGELAWYFQNTPGDNWDFDSTQPLVQADLNIGGRVRKVIMQANKNGFFYVLDRATGEFISGKPFVSGITQAQIVPGWTVQPVYTSIWHPSGTGIRYPDAQVAGVRSIIKF